MREEGKKKGIKGRVRGGALRRGRGNRVHKGQCRERREREGALKGLKGEKREGKQKKELHRLKKIFFKRGRERE